MYCSKCGHKLKEQDRYCPHCGSRVQSEQLQEDPLEDYRDDATAVGKTIYRCSDGMLRWYSEVNMLTNPTILITVYKVLGAALLIELTLVFLLMLWDEGFAAFEGLGEMLLIHLAIFAVLAVIGIIAYLIIAAMYGFKYRIIFELNDKQLRHIQLPLQFKKQRALASISLVFGLLSRNPTLMGSAMLSATKQSQTTELRKVRKLIAVRHRNLIKLEQLLNHNQIYVAPEDFDFVLNYLTAHCPQAQLIS